MKLAYILLLTLTVHQAYGILCSEKEGIVQERPFAIEYVMAELNRVHKAVFELPFDEAYIKETLVPEIEAQRQVIAPNFPAVELDGSDLPLSDAFSTWYAAHQAEFMPYIQYVDQFIIAHK